MFAYLSTTAVCSGWTTTVESSSITIAGPVSVLPGSSFPRS
ncbi:MAG: hypothetical protein J07HX64_02034 [halophilic archaeon J07HX64]|nr:MAG: hypothetical protein J07HX64_02034 [halophilic archaeon J07HX64]